ncbi:RNA polymerase sigma factor [Planctomycetota bacterium]
MVTTANSSALLWDISIPESLTGTQRWVLSAMKSHGPTLVNMLWRILGNEQDVCDAYQDTFLNLAHYEGGQKPENIKAYLFASAGNAAVSMLRTRINEKRHISEIDTSKSKIKSPSDELDSRYLLESLRYHIARLPDNLRSVILLRDLAELSYEQVGKVLSITPSTARVYRCRAVRQLSKWLHEKREKVR